MKKIMQWVGFIVAIIGIGGFIINLVIGGPFFGQHFPLREPRI
jgi:hypothetical protein